MQVNHNIRSDFKEERKKRKRKKEKKKERYFLPQLFFHFKMPFFLSFFSVVALADKARVYLQWPPQ